MQKTLPLIFALTLLTVVRAAENCAEQHDATHRFIFFAVLEGLYEDGLSNADVDQVLMKNKQNKWAYEHFVYGCGICMPAIHGLQAYRSRPEQFAHMKSDCSSFGNGLRAATKKLLYSELPEERLLAVNELMRGWISRRMTRTNMSESELAALKADLEKKRKQGMAQLTSSPNWELDYAHFKTLKGECAACNAAIGLKMMTADDKEAEKKKEQF